LDTDNILRRRHTYSGTMSHMFINARIYTLKAFPGAHINTAVIGNALSKGWKFASLATFL
jgi:hypothetical protein